MPRILAFAGSARTDSLNKKALAVAVDGARNAGAEVTVIDLRDYPIPLYDGDLEEASGMPANAQTIKDCFLGHEGLLIATPEYNSSFTPLLKNMLDWVSRPQGDEPPLAAFTGKTAALVSASPGQYGGIRSVEAMRTLLGNIRVTVIPEQATVPRAAEAFQPDGSLSDPAIEKSLRAVGKALAAAMTKSPQPA
ncbi:MAG: NADPH-dependent FMN reductase [Candidatus Melainabacteria bacterium]